MSARVAREGYDVAVIGGGLLGSSIAFGLAQRGQRVAVLDEGDRAVRAARANFGLVWVQTKGDGLPPYMHWTRRSADAWPEFARSLEALSSVPIEYRKDGGLVYCVGDVEFETRRHAVARSRAPADIFEVQLIERPALERIAPGVRFGPHVTGASFCPHDGACNPLLLMRALHTAFEKLGVHYFPGSPAVKVAREDRRFVIDARDMRVESGKVVIAAGHGTTQLAPSLDLPAPIRAERGQILVTERMRPFLPLPASGIRQTADGTVLIGSSKEDTGMNDSTTVPTGGKLAARAMQIVPELARARILRTWGGIRVLTPDNGPVYEESATCPGAFVTICHSGVTLAAAHATDLAASIAAGRLADSLAAFQSTRFDVPKAA